MNDPLQEQIASLLMEFDSVERWETEKHLTWEQQADRIWTLVREYVYQRGLEVGWNKGLLDEAKERAERAEKEAKDVKYQFDIVEGRLRRAELSNRNAIAEMRKAEARAKELEDVDTHTRVQEWRDAWEESQNEVDRLTAMVQELEDVDAHSRVQAWRS